MTKHNWKELRAHPFSRLGRELIMSVALTLVAAGCGTLHSVGVHTQPKGSVADTSTLASTGAVCKAPMLSLDTTLYQLGGGTADVVVSLHNAGTAPCILEGYPVITVSPGVPEVGPASTGLALPAVTDGIPRGDLPPTVALPDPSRAVTVQPSHRAVFYITMGSHCPGTVRAVTLHVQLPGGGGLLTLSHFGLSCPTQGIGISAVALPPQTSTSPYIGGVAPKGPTRRNNG